MAERHSFRKFRRIGAESPRGREQLQSKVDKIDFMMGANGYRFQNDRWDFDKSMTTHLQAEMRGEATAFKGPNGNNTPFYLPSGSITPEQLHRAFDQDPVLEVMHKFQKRNPDLASRIAFRLGGLARQMKAEGRSLDIADQAIAFTAAMALRGDEKSADAISTAVSMYAISGGELMQDPVFEGNIVRMAKAVSKDPVTPTTTIDLGLSQVARLRTFLGEDEALPDISHEIAACEGMPTVGAEFHFSPDVIKKFPRLWQRLAVLNMSQYQNGSFVQLSRMDRDVIEVRMNPSIYPVTIANWNHMRLLLPELNRAYHTVTLNNKEQYDFSWDKSDDKTFVNQLTALGLVTYAELFQNIPKRDRPEEVDFGTSYLGQTVRIDQGKYKFTGHFFKGNTQGSGQIGLYVGFGDKFPYFAYYAAMSLANPRVLTDASAGFLEDIHTLSDAFDTDSHDRATLFNRLEQNIADDPKLLKAKVAGERIISKLNT